jgi:hypothetical protein
MKVSNLYFVISKGQWLQWLEDEEAISEMDKKIEDDQTTEKFSVIGLYQTATKFCYCTFQLLFTNSLAIRIWERFLRFWQRNYLKFDNGEDVAQYLQVGTEENTLWKQYRETVDAALTTVGFDFDDGHSLWLQVLDNEISMADLLIQSGNKPLWFVISLMLI